MKSILLSIALLLLLTINFFSLPGATAQCLSERDDFSQPGSTDLSGILDFSLNLFKKLAPKDGKANYICSPYSIWNALVLTYFGSAGRTEANFREVLGLGDKVSTMRMWRELESLYQNRMETSKNTLMLANRAYFDRSVEVRPCMEKILRNEIQKIDFGQSAQAANTINKFVSDTTSGTIDHLFSAGDIQNAIVALVNAAYFKGSWEHVFNESSTKKAEFTGFDNTKYSVDMMNQIGGFKYGYDESLEAEIVELPYVGKTISMLIFLPTKTTISNFNSLTQGLSANKLEDILGKLSSRVVKLSIPKFSLRFKSGNKLITALKRMGLIEPFGNANFSAFTESQRLMSLGASVHEASIDVNEEGTTAGAATGITINKIGGTTIFECNHPFLFAIRDGETKNILFMGTFKSADTKTSGRGGGTATFPILNSTLNSKPGRIDPLPIDRNNGNAPSRGTNTIPDRNVPDFDLNNGNNPIGGTNTILDRNDPSIDFNGGNNPTRETNPKPDRNNPSFDFNNENNPARGTNTIHDRNDPSFDFNSGNSPTRGTNDNRDRNNPSFDFNNENNPIRRTNIIRDSSIQPVELNNENNPSRRTNLNNE